MAAQIVSAYVSRNEMPRSEIAKLLADVHVALVGLDKGSAAAPVQKQQYKKTVFPNYLICLEDGRHFKSLKRHLRVKYALTPEQYRAKWGLPADYPMVAPRYAETRSKLAKTMGLGRKPKKKR